MIILLETQRNMQWVTLPNVKRTYNLRCRDFIGQSTTLLALHRVTFTVMSSSSSDRDMRDIMHMSPNLKDIHVRLPSTEAERRYQLPVSILSSHRGRPCLLSMVTRLTFESCKFGNRGSILRNVSFPALRALAVVDCTSEYQIFNGFDATQCPQLTALMVKGSNSLMTEDREHFLKGLHSLRELLLDGEGSHFKDTSSLTQHANTLELLLIHGTYYGRQNSVFSGTEQVRTAVLSSLKAIHHLSIYIGADNFHLSTDRKLVGWRENAVHDGLLVS
jgi:hypothetical protein